VLDSDLMVCGLRKRIIETRLRLLPAIRIRFLDCRTAGWGFEQGCSDNHATAEDGVTTREARNMLFWEILKKWFEMEIYKNTKVILA